ncbi:MAG: insulinase family protein [Sphingorhabdus sp.]
MKVSFLTRATMLACCLLLPTAILAEAVAPVPVDKAAPTKSVEVPWLYEGSDVPVDASWKFGKLPNGVRYAVKHNDVPAGQVSIRVRIDAGSLYEEDSEQGYAHLIEHLAFRGSEHVPDGEAKRVWQRFGVTFGSDSNAQTTPTQTVYQLDLPNAKTETLDESMNIIAGMIRKPSISQAALDAERAIVLAEMRESSGAQMVYADKSREHVFQGQRMAKRSPIGTPQTLLAAKAEGLAAFHKRWYRPETSVVVLSGDAPIEQMEALVAKHFGDWKAAVPAVAQPDFGKPVKTGDNAALVVDPTLPSIVSLYWVRPWEKVQDTIVYNQGILINALAQRVINRRLESKARDNATYTVALVNQDKEARSVDLTTVSLRPVAGKWREAIAEVRSVIADAVAAPPSQDDIDRELALFHDVLRTQLDSYPFEAASTQADDMVRAVDIRETIAAPQTVLQVFEAMRNQFTPDRVFKATQALFMGEVQRIVMASPNAVDGGQTALAKAMTDPVTAGDNVRLSQGSISFADLPQLGSPGKVAISSMNRDFETENLIFSNGVRAILSPNKSESGQVRVLVRFGRGFQAVSPDKGGLLWSGPMVLGENGIGKFDRNAIDKLTNGRRLELSFSVDNDAFEFSAATRPEDLADQLKLIATKLEYPGWHAASVERAKALASAEYDSYAMSAMTMVQRDVQQLVASGDPRWKTPAPADIAKLTPQLFQSFWAPILASGPVEVLVFGDFDRDKAVAALEASLGAMKRRKAALVPVGADQIAFPAIPPSPVRLTHKGPTDQVAAVIVWPTGGGLANITEGRQLEILAAIFRDRLFEKFRSEQAASYSPDMMANWPDEFRSGGFLMAFSQVKPEDAESFLRFSREIATDLAANAVSKDELQRAVEPAKQAIERTSSGNVFWMNQMEGASFSPERYKALTHYYSDYAGVTAEQLQALAKRYFRPEKAWTLLVEPEKK